MGDLHFLGLGGTDEVGASSYLYLLKEGNLLIELEHVLGLSGKPRCPSLACSRITHPPRWS